MLSKTTNRRDIHGYIHSLISNALNMKMYVENGLPKTISANYLFTYRIYAVLYFRSCATWYSFSRIPILFVFIYYHGNETVYCHSIMYKTNTANHRVSLSLHLVFSIIDYNTDFFISFITQTEKENRSSYVI